MTMPAAFNGFVARRIADEHGIELTGDEVETIRQQAYASIRREMRALGHKMPDSDIGMMALLARALKARRE